jgi:creatinine amidohydrolase
MRVLHYSLIACLLGTLAAIGTARAQELDKDPRSMGGGNCSANPYNCADAKNPLPAANAVWIEEMTWMDVRDALAAGKNTVIIPAGGIEPNGPWIALGKHNYIVKPLCEAIARKLGNALCAPVVPFVPEGDIDVKDEFMKTPGTIGVTDATFEGLLTDIARSLKTHGFKTILLIGDHGGDVKGMEAVAAKLQQAWKFAPAVYYIPEFYKSWDGAVDLLYKKGLGKAGVTDGLHDDPTVTMLMMLTDPHTVRWAERKQIGQAHIDGVSVADKEKALVLGRELLEYRAAVTVQAINKATAGQAAARPQ